MEKIIWPEREDTNIFHDRKGITPASEGWYSIHLPRSDGRLSWPRCLDYVLDRKSSPWPLGQNSDVLPLRHWDIRFTGFTTNSDLLLTYLLTYIINHIVAKASLRAKLILKKFSLHVILSYWVRHFQSLSAQSWNFRLLCGVLFSKLISTKLQVSKNDLPRPACQSWITMKECLCLVYKRWRLGVLSTLFIWFVDK